MPPARGVPSRPSARRSMSAPVSWVVSAFAASASAAARRSALSIATHLPPDRTSGRDSLASSRISAAVSSTSSNTADQRTSASWLAPTAVSFDSANSRSIGVARTSDGHHLPRLLLAEDGVAAAIGAGAQQLGQHALEPGHVLLDVGAL